MHPPLISTLTSSACLPIPLVLRTLLWVSQLPHKVAAGWTSLQSWPVSYAVCGLLLPAPLCTPFPPPLLWTLLLPWTVRKVHSPLSFGAPLSQSLPSCRGPPVPCLELRIWSVMMRSLPFSTCPVPSGTFCSCSDCLACRQ